MQDGQNLFDPGAFFFGRLGPDGSLDALLSATCPPAAVLDVIVAAPDNGGLSRIYEYTPTADPSYCSAPSDCGGADAYLDFVGQELLPEVRARYRVAAGRLGIAGPRWGGWSPMYACWSRPADSIAAASLPRRRCGGTRSGCPPRWPRTPGPKRELLLYLAPGPPATGWPGAGLATDLAPSRRAGLHGPTRTSCA
jgi:hypothetical protein